MVTESSVSLTDVVDSIGKLRTDLQTIQRELDQALSVWRTTLIDEKKEFQELLHQKQESWKKYEAEWEEQRAAYEKKIQELETLMNEKLAAVEENSRRALNDLEAAWQQNKAEWEKSAPVETSTPSFDSRYDALKETYEQDKFIWQETLRQILRDFNEREALWSSQSQRQSDTIDRIQQPLQEIQNTLMSLSADTATWPLANHLDLLERHVDLIGQWVAALEPRPEASANEPVA